MSNAIITIDNLTAAVAGELDQYNAEITAQTKKATTQAMKELVARTVATAPESTGHYKHSITSRTLQESRDGLTKQWYVKAPHYRLTHLLNYGHALRNGGRYQGTGFLTDAFDAVSTEYELKVKEVIDGAG